MSDTVLFQSSDLPDYGGRRILEAMNEAPRYASAIEHQIVRYATASERILDFGAGDGLYSDRLRDRCLSIDCVELDPELRRQLTARGYTAFETLKSCPSQTYDLVYSINVMEHIDQVSPIFNELARVLKSGGKAFVFVPAFEILWTSLDTEVGHVRRFDKQLMSDLMSGAGLRVVESYYFDSLGFAAALGVRLLEAFNAFRYNANSIGFYDRYCFPISAATDRLLSGIVGKNLIAIGQKS